MVKTLCKDTFLLSQKALQACSDDLTIGMDLLDTLKYYSDSCVGMAANMIGENKSIIAFQNEKEYLVMFNPVIVKKSIPYKAKEGCLCLSGQRETIRYKAIQVRYQNEKFQIRTRSFKDFPAEIIQHEIDHLNGILI